MKLFRFQIEDGVSVICGDGSLTPAVVIRRERYGDGQENYYVVWEDDGRRFFSWILSDDLQPRAEEALS